MIITVKNLGVIKKAEFDTSKKLTVFCGPNSTGKTYLAYIIYAVFSNYRFRNNLKSFNEVKNLINSHSKQIPLKKEYFDELLSQMAKSIKKRIGEIFGISEEKESVFFNKFSINLTISDKEFKKLFDLQPTLKIGIEGDKTLFEFVLKKKQTNYFNTDFFYFSKIPLPQSERWQIMLSSLIRFPNVYMLPVERNSIYTFKTELSLSRNQLLDTILDKKANISRITDLLNNNTRRYPLVIKDTLYIANDLTNIQKINSELYPLAKELEEDLLKGTISVTQNGDVEYNVKNNTSLTIGISSSIVKTLSSLIITLKHQANKKDLLIIDEPEMNFHPDNQVELAKILAKIANNTPLLISTHSDYIIREINNLIVAKSLEARGNNKYEQFYDKESLLDFNDVQVLYFKHSKDGKVNVTSLDIDEYGFAVESMDETINKQNERMQILFGQMDDK